MKNLRLLIICLVAVALIWFVVNRTNQDGSSSSPTAPAPRQAATPAATGAPASATATSASVPATAPLNVYFLDVGQGDSILLKGPDFTFLIDAGRHERNDVVPYLEEIGVEPIDVLIGTHPHADHIGQLPQVLERFPVSEVWMSGDTNTTKTFEEAIDAIADSGAVYHEPRAGEVYEIGSARIEVLNPDQLTGEVNEGSVSTRIVFGKIAFMLTGDAEAETERAIIARGYDLRSQILKLGHHGSRTSSTLSFLQAAHPEIAIWSAEVDSDYGHPHAEVLERLQEPGVTVYGTAINSTIVVATDGERYWVRASGPVDAAAPPTPTLDPSVVTVNRNVELYAGPGANYEVVAQLDSGTPVTPLARNEQGNWIYVKELEGQEGWVAQTMLDNFSDGALAVRIAPTPTVVPRAAGCAEGQVDINTASLNELQKIAQIGPARARDIRELRPFESVADLVRVNGIGEAMLEIIVAQGLACVE